jgi:hypothetical protein
MVSISVPYLGDQRIEVTAACLQLPYKVKMPPEPIAYLPIFERPSCTEDDDRTPNVIGHYETTEHEKWRERLPHWRRLKASASSERQFIEISHPELGDIYGERDVIERGLTLAGVTRHIEKRFGKGRLLKRPNVTYLPTYMKTIWKGVGKRSLILEERVGEDPTSGRSYDIVLTVPGLDFRRYLYFRDGIVKHADVSIPLKLDRLFSRNRRILKSNSKEWLPVKKLA